MKLKVWILFSALFITIVCYFLWNKWNTISTDYGKNYNKSRLMLHVPLIEENMTQAYNIDSFLANHWEANDKLPDSEEPIHYLKNVTPINPLNRVEEKDMFKKRIDSNSYYKLYLNSTIKDNSSSVREGLLTTVNDSEETSFPIDEDKIDSIALEWNLHYLVKSNNKTD